VTRVEQLLAGKDVFMSAVDAGRAISKELRIPRMDAMRLMWDAQKAGELRARIIDAETCVNVTQVKALISKWRMRDV
jgi:hypothetical protein